MTDTSPTLKADSQARASTTGGRTAGTLDEKTENRRRTDFHRGVHWFDSLDRWQADRLGEDTTPDTFDWEEWGFERQPSASFLKGVDAARLAYGTEEAELAQ